MKLFDVIPRKSILLQLKARDKKSALQELVKALRAQPGGERLAAGDVVDRLMARERTGSTGIGQGVAVPHAKLDSLKSNVLGVFGRVDPGIDFDAIDGEPVQIIFLILMPAKNPEPYLSVLRKISQAVRMPNVVRFLKAAKTVREIEEVFREVEEGGASPRP